MLGRGRQPGSCPAVCLRFASRRRDLERPHLFHSGDGVRHRKPQAGDSWVALAEQHPEFFRIWHPPDKPPTISLVARYVLDSQTLPTGEEVRPVLDTTVTNKLMELAVNLHDRQLERSQLWKTVTMPIVVALLAAVASFGSALIDLAKPVDCKQMAQPTKDMPEIAL